MTFLYREEPFFNQSCTLLKLLMDVENAIWQWRCEYLSRDILVFSRAVYRSSSGSGDVGICLETFWLSACTAVYRSSSGSGDVSICLETFWSSADPYTAHRLAVVM